MLEVCWHGTATLSFHSGGSHVVSDPFLGREPAHTPTTREAWSDAQAVILTHGHFDHTADLPVLMAERPLPVHAGPRTARRLRRQLGAEHVHPITWRSPVKLGSMWATPIRAQHITFDKPLVRSTLRGAARHPRSRHLSRLPSLLREHLAHPMGECIAWHLRAGDTTGLLLGSLALDATEIYPTEVDWLFLPYQGHTHLDAHSLDIITRLRPKGVFVHHFDDTFPPVSSPVDTAPLVRQLERAYPQLRVIVPALGECVRLDPES